MLMAEAKSFIRASHDRVRVLSSLSDAETNTKLKQVVKPNSFPKTLKKVGLLLMLSPDPLTDIPGAVLLGASQVMKKKDPASVESVFDETRTIIEEFRLLR